MVASAQVTVDPPFPQEDDDITVFYDATQGTAGLENCNCEVYLHTGVTNAGASGWTNVPTTWGEANPDWLMEPVPGEPNLYSKSYNIRDFYGLSAGQEIQSLNFVFRNADGSQEGKAPGGADIFYRITGPDDQYELRLLSPISNTIAEEGEPLRVYAATSLESTFIALYVDGTLIGEVSGNIIDTVITVLPGQHEVSILARSEPVNGAFFNDGTSFEYFGTADLSAVALPSDAEPGYRVSSDGLHEFYLYAPLKERAVLTLVEGLTIDTTIQLAPTTDGTGFYTKVDLDLQSTFQYQYIIDGAAPIADPFSEVVLDPNNDSFISGADYPELQVVSPLLDQTITTIVRDVPAFTWQNDGYDRPAEEDLVIYELLIRDFTEEHSYQSLIDSLGYFQRLGINAIELMPINEFEGNLSWGYNPSYHAAIDKYYGPPENLKAFVDAAHGAGIAVIVDVVFNHGFGQNPYVQLYGAERSNSPGGAGPFFNTRARHPFNVGTDANHESEHMQFYTNTILQRWLRDYHIDGYRFDLSKGFTQTDSGDNVGAWSNYDASRIAILTAYQNAIQAIDPDAFVILEHFAARQEEIELTDLGMFTWGNMNFNYAEAAMGYVGNDLNGVTPQSRGMDHARLVGYMESHDEPRVLWKIDEFGNANADYSTKDYATGLARMELVSAFFYTTPGAKMLWQFGEYGYDIDINLGGRTGNKPILWDLLERPANKRLFDVTAAMIKLRKDYPVFARGEHQLPSGLATGFFKSMYIEHPDMDAVVIGNFDIQAQTGTSTFPGAGRYYDYFSGDSLEVVGTGDYVDLDMSLAPGEYHLYTSERLPAPPGGYLGVVSSTDRPVLTALMVAPNPANDRISIRVPSGESIREVYAFDGLGRRFTLPVQDAHANVSGLVSGAYAIRAITESGRSLSARIVKQ